MGEPCQKLQLGELDVLRMLVLVLLLAPPGCATFKTWEHVPATATEEQTIYVVGHGWHTGLVLNAKQLGGKLHFVVQHLGEYPYYEIGWGDKEFYQAKEVTSGIAIRAIFWPTESVLHVVGVPEVPQAFFPHSQVIQVRLSQEGLDHMKRAILRSFKLEEGGSGHPSQEGLYGRSLFFEGAGFYYMTNTCNTWTARMLDEAGVPISSFLTLTAGSVLNQTQDAMTRYPCCPGI